MTNILIALEILLKTSVIILVSAFIQGVRSLIRWIYIGGYKKEKIEATE